MNRVLGICNLHDGPHLGKLTANRPLGTVTFLGRYGIIDFALSNFSNSGIDKVCILVEDHIEAVRNHTGNGQVWISNTKIGFQKLIFNEKNVSSPKFNTDVNNILENIDIFDDISADYIVIAPPFFAMNIDYKDVINEHAKSGKEISVVYSEIKDNIKDFANCDSVYVKNGEITKFSNDVGKNKNVSLEVFVFNKDAFYKMIKFSKETSAIFTLRKAVAYALESNLIEVNAIKFNDLVVPFLSFNGYVENSMKMLDQDFANKFFKKDRQIYTTVHNTPPVLYGPNAKIKNSYIANGSIVDGTVENSILSRDVIIKKGAVVKNCILFTKTKIDNDVQISNVVADKRSIIKVEKNVKGDENSYLYIGYGTKI